MSKSYVETWVSLDGIAKSGERYEVSDRGRINSLRSGMTLKPKVDKSGYCRVNLCGIDGERTHLVHRLVALAFLPNPEEKPEVNHKNGNPSDNNVANLEWSTPKENIDHAWRTGLAKADHNSIAVSQYNLDGELIRTFKSALQASAATGMDSGNVLRQCRTHCAPRKYSFYFRFADPHSSAPS